MSKEYKKETIGNMVFTPTKMNHLYIQGEIILFGVEYRYGAHFFRWSDGKFYLDKENENRDYMRILNSLFMSRKGSLSDPTEAAKKRCLFLITPEVQKWAKEHHEDFRQAQKASSELEIKNLKAKIAELQNEIAGHETQIKIIEATQNN